MDWTPEMDSILRENAGKIPYAEIGKMFGVSKAAISGRANRLGIANSTGVPRGERRLTPEEYGARLAERRRKDAIKKRLLRSDTAKPRRRMPEMIDKRFVPAQVDVTPLHIDLLDLEQGQCRFPYGDRPPFTFCGCPALKGFSYCGPHQEITHTEARMDAEQFTQHKRAFRAQMIAEAA